MFREAGAWIALVAVTAAIVPGGLARLSSSAQSCCGTRHCPMAGGPQRNVSSSHAVHCEGSGNAAESETLGACPCSISPGSGMVIPPTAFHFTLDTSTVADLFPRDSRLQKRTRSSSAQLRGYHSPLDQPPKASQPELG